MRQFIETTVLPRTDRQQVSDDEPLLDAGVIDSMGVFELVAHLEDECGVKIEDDEVVPANFNSIDDIAAFVNRKRPS